MASGRDRFYFPPPQSIDQGSIADRANRVAEGLATSGDLDGIQEDIAAVGGVANGAQVVATEAIAAANEANNTVQSLINGGIRTLHTVDFDYVPPPNLVKVGVTIFNGGGAGQYGSRGGAGGIGGGYIYQEFPASVLPALVACTVASGRSGGPGAIQANNPTSFGTFLTGASGGKGAIITAGGPTDANGAAPGNGGTSGLNNDSPNGTAGGTSLDATGGAGGNASTIVGGDGANAPTNKDYLSGGGGGGGGRALTAIGAASGRGGNGGFPGGAGGAGGADSFTQYTGGAGAPGLMGITEFLK